MHQGRLMIKIFSVVVMCLFCSTSITITAGTVASDAENRVAGNGAGVAPNGVVTKQ